MSTSVEPILTTSPAMNVHGIHAQPHSPHTLPVPSPRHQLTGTTEKGQASPAAAPSTSTAPPSYLYYQPGVHSKAGPLPPPPRAMFDIDFKAPPPPRPPRLRSPSPLTSQKSPGAAVTTSVTVRLDPKASTTSIHQVQINPPPPVSTGSSSGDSEHPPEPATGPSSPDLAVHHSREGAFPPSTILISPPERLHSLPDDPNRHPSNDECSPSTSRSPELLPENSSVSNSNDASPNSPESSRRAFEDTRSDVPQEPNGSCPIIREFAAEDSPLEAKRKGGVLTSLKRYSSLPRTPSVKSQRMSIVTRSPSPESPPRRRIRTRSPDAMRFKDILNKRSALERAIGYANKINELSTYDCGLGDWVVSMKERGSSKPRLVPPPSPMQNSNSPLAPRPRHTSRTSISSEVTFPLRADSYIATDLSQRDIDTVPSPNVPPPALPYPALAGVPPPINFRHSTTTMGSQSPLTVPLSAGAKATGSFFSSLGRNASMMRRDSTKPTQHARLTKPPPGVSTSAPNPRPVQITNAPSVPGGPRALPNRVQRSRTLMLAPSPTKASAEASSSSSPLTRRRSNTLKRPSFFGRSHGPGPSPERGAPTSADFTQQIDRLADLLPHADRDVLAGYLRRAGQDILAIGQYLEDEKNGTVRRD
ncbi:hypothetical protein BC826DRAFT_1105862 [Russula brevipes]|nr:hypothetical protein BC826DRAFT_1105862 [Russula brevipes]